MEQGLYSLGSSMLYLQKKINVVANNISNSDTKGFKKDRILGRSFNVILSSEMKKILPAAEKRWNSGLLEFQAGIYVDNVMTDYSQGVLEDTKDNSNISMSGNGFITLINQNRVEYVRCATVEIDPEGFLSVPYKGRLVGTNGFIKVGNDEYRIGKSGTVYVNGREIDTIRIVDFADKESLEKTGNGTYIGGGNIIEAAGELVQGKLEASNVELTEEITDMMQISRHYETSQRAVQMMDQIYGIAANKIGKVY